MESSYIESLEEPWKTFAAIVVPSVSEGESLPVAATRLDQLEIAIRSKFLHLFFETKDDNLVDVVGDFWRRTLDLCLHLVHEASKEEPSPAYENISPRRLPIVLLEDGLDALSVQHAKDFWSKYVEPALNGPDLLLGNLMWRSSTVCSLPFLRVCNQFLRILDMASHSDQGEWKGRVLIALAKGLSVADRSALKLWGTFHSANVNNFENEDKFRENHPHDEEGSTDTSKMEYRLYESFWSLQADFASPNHIQIGSFMKKLKIVMDALEHAAAIRVDPSTTPASTSIKYLTASSLLPTQLASPEFRSTVISQFLILSMHLSSESPALASALTPYLVRAKKLLDSDDSEHYHVVSDSILLHRENAWRRWKKDKCPVAAFAPKPKTQAASGSPKGMNNALMYGALGDSETTAENEYESFQTNELLKLSEELREVLPTLEDHLAPYVEALDPESGIEAEYHPGNDALFSWRAMRLFAKHQLTLLKQCRKASDLERITRELYRSKGEEIPGEMMPQPKLKLDDESVTSNVDQAEHSGVEDMEEDDAGSKGYESDNAEDLSQGPDQQNDLSLHGDQDMKNDDYEAKESDDEGECAWPQKRETEQDGTSRQSEPTGRDEITNPPDENEDEQSAIESESARSPDDREDDQDNTSVRTENEDAGSLNQDKGNESTTGDQSEPIVKKEIVPSLEGNENEQDETTTRLPTIAKTESTSDDREPLPGELDTKMSKVKQEERPRDMVDEGEVTAMKDSVALTRDGRPDDSFEEADPEGSTENPDQRSKHSSNKRRRDRDRDRKRKRSDSHDHESSSRAKRDDRRDGGRGSRRDDGPPGGRRREDSPSRGRDRRQESAQGTGRPPQPPPNFVGHRGALPPHNRGGGRPEDRPVARGGRPPEGPRRRDDGPPIRDVNGRGGGDSQRRDDHRRGRGGYSGGRR